MKDPYLLHIFNPTKNVSPFDVNMAYEAEFDGVIPYSNVTLEEIHHLTQDTIFSRGPKGVKRTGIFIGGRDFGLAIDMLRRAQAAMVPPFAVSVFADPSGAITTAAALIACIEHWTIKQTDTALEDKKIYIFGGTGPVGICAGILASNCGAKVYLVSHRGAHIAKEIASECNARYGSSLQGACNTSNEETTELIRSADIIVGAAKAGVRIASKKQLSLSENLFIAADVNAVPPSGFEGIAADDDGKIMTDLNSKAIGIGALAIGDVKYKVHTRIFELMMSDEVKYYEHNEAFKIARQIVKHA